MMRLYKTGDEVVDRWEDTGLLFRLGSIDEKRIVAYALELVDNHMKRRQEKRALRSLVLASVTRLVRANMNRILSIDVLNIIDDIEAGWNEYIASYGGSESMKAYENEFKVDLEAEFCASYSQDVAPKYLL